MIGDVETLVLSPRVTVDVAEMDGVELGYADAVLGAAIKPLMPTPVKGERMDMNNPAIGIALSRVYAVSSIRKFNGEDVAPYRNLAEFKRIAGKLGAREIAVLQRWSAPIYTPDEDDSKNEQSAPSSE